MTGVTPWGPTVRRTVGAVVVATALVGCVPTPAAPDATGPVPSVSVLPEVAPQELDPGRPTPDPQGPPAADELEQIESGLCETWPQEASVPGSIALAVTEQDAEAVGMSLGELVEEAVTPWDADAYVLYCRFDRASLTWAAGEPLRVAAAPAEVAALLEGLDGNASLLDAGDDAPYATAATHVRAQLDPDQAAEVESRATELRLLHDAAG